LPDGKSLYGSALPTVARAQQVAIRLSRRREA
jgi:hypothetical protein